MHGAKGKVATKHLCLSLYLHVYMQLINQFGISLSEFCQQFHSESLIGVLVLSQGPPMCALPSC